MYELDMPANMLTIVKKLPYRLRGRWRTVACEIQERHQERAIFSDIVDFIERQARILTDPVFGNIQDTPLSKSLNRTTSKPTLRPNKRSFATNVNTMESDTETREQTLDSAIPAKVCLFCEAEHTLETCPQLKKKAHREKIAFLKKNGIRFAVCV